MKKNKLSNEEKQYDFNKDGVLDKDELEYKNKIDNLKEKKLKDGLDSTWFETQLKKIKKPKKGGDDLTKEYF